MTRVDDSVGDPEPAHDDPDRDAEEKRRPMPMAKCLRLVMRSARSLPDRQEGDERRDGRR